MEQSKIINVDIDINLKETNVRNLDAVFFSRDVNAAKIHFNITKDGEKLSDSTSASLLITSSNYWGALKDGLNIKLNRTVKDGEVTFELPNDILGYEGFVRGDLYIYWEDGSNDVARPILFSVKRSALDSTASTMSVVYVDEFEVEKARVKKAADDAIGTIDTILPTLQSKISDTQEKAQTIKDQLESLKRIKTAWSNSADGTAAFTTVYPNLNLLTGTSTKVIQATDWNMQVANIKYDKSLGGDLCASVMINNAEHASSLLRGSARIVMKTFDKSGKVLETVWGNEVSYNADGLSQCHVSIDDNTANVQAFVFTNSMVLNGFYSRLKIEPGSTATPYMPSSSEVTLKDYPTHRGIGVLDSTDPMDYQWEQSDTYRDYKEQQLKTAIIALGGSL